MKKTTRLRAIVLSLAMVLGMLLPAASHAQSDGFFRDGGGDYSNRDAGGGSFSLGAANLDQIGSTSSSGMSLGGLTQQDPAPLGSGLLILTAIGAGYATLKRKRS